MVLQYLMIHPEGLAPGRRLTKEYCFLTRNLLLVVTVEEVALSIQRSVDAHHGSTMRMIQ
jgi:hypothetical protein